MPKQHVLIAVDLTDEADEVMSAGCDLAARFDADITVLTVVRPLSFLVGDMATGAIGAQYAGFEQELAKQAEKGLAELTARHGDEAHQNKVVIGQPAAEIRQMAESLGVDTIVIGTHGRHGFGRLLGSTANGVLHGVPCNVLVVKVTTED